MGSLFVRWDPKAKLVLYTIKSLVSSWHIAASANESYAGTVIWRQQCIQRDVQSYVIFALCNLAAVFLLRVTFVSAFFGYADSTFCGVRVSVESEWLESGRMRTCFWKLIVRVELFLRKTVSGACCDWRFDTLSGCHLDSRYHDRRWSRRNVNHNNNHKRSFSRVLQPGRSAFTNTYTPSLKATDSHKLSLYSCYYWLFSKNFPEVWFSIPSRKLHMFSELEHFRVWNYVFTCELRIPE